MRHSRLCGTAALLLLLAPAGWAGGRPRDERTADEARRAVAALREALGARPAPAPGEEAQEPAATWQWHLEHAFEIAVDELDKGNDALALESATRAAKFLAALDALRESEQR
jgi:hypothetical protein